MNTLTEPIRVGLLGSGNFVRNQHLNNLVRHPGFAIRGVADPNLESAREVASEAGEARAVADPHELIADPDLDLVFIVTPHFTHAELAIAAAKAGKHIYCEKPMGLTEEECLAVKAAVEEAGVVFLAGYNRSVAPFTRTIRERLAKLDAPMLIHHRFADWNPYSTGWLIDERLSGGRIIGEGGHSLDTMCRLVGADPVRVYAEGGNFAEPSPTQAPDSALITLGFPDGSAGTLLISSVANNDYPKEELIVTCANTTFVVKDFQQLTIYGPEGTEEEILPERDRGLGAMLDAAYGAIRAGEENPTRPELALRTSRLTFAAVRSIRERRLVEV